MYYTIYKILNLVNNKIYIGQHRTNNLDDGYMGSGKQIKNSIKKYGIENFNKEILFVFNSEEEMNNKEKELVTEDFCKRIDTYNMHEGGFGGFAHIRISPKYKEWCSKGGTNASNLNKNNPNWGINKFVIGDPKVKQLSIIANNCRKLYGVSEETKRKISQHQLNNNSMKNRCWCVKENCLDYTSRKVFEKNKIPEGWISVKEHRDLQKSKKGSYGNFWIYNPIIKENKYTNGIIPEGWYKGRKLEYYQKKCRSGN